MKVSYSKMILGGIIASTFLMVSCQKKGTATGVKPQVAQANTQVEKEEREPVEPLMPLEARGPVTADNKPKADLPNIRVPAPASSDASVAKAANSDASVASSSDTTSVKVEAKNEEVKSAANEKVNKTENKYCSTEIYNTLTNVSDKYIVVMNQANDKTVEAKAKLAALDANVKACDAFEAAFAKSKVETCLLKNTKEDLKVTENFYDKFCDYAGVKAKEMTGKENKYAARVEKAAKDALIALKSEKLVVSEEAKPLFEKDNQDWKMFLVDGTIQTDSIKLEDALKAKKVACTIKATPEKYTDAVKVTLAVQSIADYLVINTESDETKSGVDIAMSLKAESDADAPELTKATLTCSNLSAKNINIKKLKAALGSHIAIETAKEETKDDKATIQD